MGDSINTLYFDFIEQRRRTLELDEFIELSENRFFSQVKSVASEAINNNVRLIRLAGPSGSGKTTSAKKIVEVLRSKGVPAYYMSMDNWYKTLKVEHMPRNEDGDPDYESPELLDIEAVKSDLQDLLNGKTTRLRQFDFHNRVSLMSDVELTCENNSIVVMEGIHAINPIFDIPGVKQYKVYVEPSNVKVDEDNIITSSQIRLCRRIHRDLVDRGMSLEDTIKKCKSVDRGQDKYIEPYTRDTQILRVDTLIYYELFIHRNELADEHIIDIIPESDIRAEIIPDGSILREFYK